MISENAISKAKLRSQSAAQVHPAQILGSPNLATYFPGLRPFLADSPTMNRLCLTRRLNMPQGSLLILIVEDEAATLASLCNMTAMQYPNLTIHSSDNGQSGLECFKLNSPDGNRHRSLLAEAPACEKLYAVIDKHINSKPSFSSVIRQKSRCESLKMNCLWPMYCLTSASVNARLICRHRSGSWNRSATLSPMTCVPLCARSIVLAPG